MTDDDFIRAEIPALRKLVQDECWLEGERRGVPVDPADEFVQERVAEIILSGLGEALRHPPLPSPNLP